MFGMSHESYLLLDAVVTIIGLIVLITKFKVHPFIALIIAAGFLGLTSGMPVDKIIKAFQDGFGGVLGFVGIILALGTMLGKMMAESGGADQIAQTLIRAFGKEKVQWAMMFAAFLVGIPLFFEIGFVLLIPLVFIVARRTGVSLIKIGIPLLAGLSAVHGLVPPHPGPLLAIGVFGADIGKTILYGLIVALPTAIIAGPIFGTFIAKYIPGNPSQELVDQLAREPESKDLPSFSITLITVLLPVFLMLLKTFADVALPDGHAIRNWMDMIGHPITALLLALLLSLYTFGRRQGDVGEGFQQHQEHRQQHGDQGDAEARQVLVFRLAGQLVHQFLGRVARDVLGDERTENRAGESEHKNLPSFSITLITVLLPVFLMLLKTFADIGLPDGHIVRNWMHIIGHPISALLLALLLSLYTFGHRQGIHSKQILKLLDASLAPTAAIILIIGAGGGFKQMLVTSGVGDVIGHMAVNAQINPILLAWLVAAVIRVATGSAPWP